MKESALKNFLAVHIARRNKTIYPSNTFTIKHSLERCSSNSAVYIQKSGQPKVSENVRLRQTGK